VWTPPDQTRVPSLEDPTLPL